MDFYQVLDIHKFYDQLNQSQKDNFHYDYIKELGDIWHYSINLLINNLYFIINELIDYSRSYLEETLNENINKLKLLYPQCFSAEDSIARVDVK